jgi:HAE1 family hydrophobic/amphiphilic exporter-1
MTLSDTAIKNSVFAWMLLLGIIVFGAISFRSLGRSLLPDVDFPVLNITLTWQGAAPDVMETEIVDIVEEAIAGVQGVQEITSSSQRGIAQITVQFSLDKDIDVAVQEVQTHIAAEQRFLPTDMDPPIILKSNPDDTPIIWLSLTGNVPPRELMEYTNNILKDQFTVIDGVSEVLLGGYLMPALRVWMDPDKMKAREITAEDVVLAIQNEHYEVPAGFIDTRKKTINIRVLGEAADVKEFSSMIIPIRRNVPIYRNFRIKDVATVEEGMQDVNALADSNGTLAVGLGIKKQPGSNAVEVAHRVKEKLAEVQKYLPSEYRLGIRFDTTTFIEDNANDMNFIIILSIMLTALVCWIFLGSIGTAFNVFLTIPMAVFGTFFVIKLFGFTLNTFTYLGLSLVIGIVVDDAIMMVENISRHRESGEPRLLSAVVGAREITFAAIAASIAIVAIFAPVIFMQGVIGRYFYQFGITISAAVLISLLGALTVTPMYCSQFLPEPGKGKKKPFMENFMDKFKDGYRKFLSFCLDNRWKVLLIATAVFISSLSLIFVIKKEFVPAQDQGRIAINISTPPGSSIYYTQTVMRECEKILQSHPEVDAFFAPAGFGGPNYAAMFVSLKDKSKRPRDPVKKRALRQDEIMNILRKQMRAVPGVTTFNIQDLSLSGFTAKRGYPVEFTLIGSDWDKLAQLSRAMLDEMNRSGVMIDCDSDYQPGVIEAQVFPDREKAAKYGVSVESIGFIIDALFGSYIAGKYTKGDKRYDILVELQEDKKADLGVIPRMWVRNINGEVVKLADVVKIVQKPTVVSITRENRERAVRIFSNVPTGKSQGEALTAVEKIAKKVLPEGYRIVFTGGSQSFRDSFSSLYVAMILGIFVAYMVLGIQFNSFVHPFVVLLALPFSISGAFAALLATGKTINIYSIIGMILLMGIVKKNSILLVDFTNQRRRHGMNVREALLDACPVRLRPIIMTSMATIAAAVPPALSIGQGSESRVPMAIVVIGGVIFSTLLTLLVVPCAYSLMSGLERKGQAAEAGKVIEKVDNREVKIKKS